MQKQHKTMLSWCEYCEEYVETDEGYCVNCDRLIKKKKKKKKKEINDLGNEWGINENDIEEL